MENSKLTDLLKTFTESEIKDFEKFLLSPYFTNGRDLTPYYKFLIKYYPEFNISKTELLKKFFKKSDITDSKKDNLIRTYNWELLKFAEEFITFDMMKNNKAGYDDFFITALLRRQLAKRSAQVYDGMIEYQNSYKMDHYVFMNRMFLQSNGVAVKRLNGKRNETLPLFQQQAENLLNFFLHHAEHLLTTISANKALFKTDNTSNNIFAFLNNVDFEKYFAEREGFENDLEIQKMAVYSILISLDENNFEKYIHKLKESLEKNIANFGKEGMLHITSSILKILGEKNEPQYQNLKFDLINFALQNDFYFDNHYKAINTFKYKKAIWTALSLNEIEWAKKFSESYIVKLVDEQQENMKTLANAYIEFKQMNYENSLNHISKFVMFDIPTNCMLKELQIKNFFKLSLIDEQYYDTLNSFIDAFRHYLKENCKISDAYYLQGMEFIEGVNILKEYYLHDSNRKKNDLIYQLQSFEMKYYNNWISEEINSALNKINKIQKKIA